MSVCCPKCGSRFLKIAKISGAGIRFAALRGIHALQCGDCKNRFTGRTLVVSDVRYARCPKCLRMDLNLWSEREFQGTRWMRMLIRMGARRLRCEYCRFNFASFRKRKEIFTFRRWAKFEGGEEKAMVSSTSGQL